MSQLVGNPQSVRVSKIISDNERVRTLVFPMRLTDKEIQPGQFLMVWVPGVDDIPMSVSMWNPPNVGITVLPVGEATQSLTATAERQWLGIRGPFGNHFDPQSGRVLVVGGGIGIAPLRFLVYRLREVGADITFLMAARTAKNLVFVNEFSKQAGKKIRVKIATDDGSAGFKGLATDAAEDLLRGADFDIMYTCGPERMMAGLYRIASQRRIQFQASLERFMKCGCGICGSCALDPTGELVCLDGPVFTGERLAQLNEFGKYCRDSTGARKAL
ncbi:MAG: dihydroorotate dehydrogenase electron transfer subunit [Candidatus Thorarchaeota archaeon]|nr:MAG: dihydroorotate dehydrogenase electron transfer subunit [Candidatus Thorarchaeota archaeon]